MSTESKSEMNNQKSKILYLFTRTPLHVGAGASVGATGFSILHLTVPQSAAHDPQSAIANRKCSWTSPPFAPPPAPPNSLTFRLVSRPPMC